MTEDDIRAVLRDLRDEPVPADSRARVRAAVTKRTGSHRLLRWLWVSFAAAAAAAAMAAAIFATVWLRPLNQPIAPLAIAVLTPVSPAIAKSKVNVAVRPKLPIERRHAVKKSDVEVRIETADPDIVILLVAE